MYIEIGHQNQPILYSDTWWTLLLELYSSLLNFRDFGGFE